jgi:predicted RNA methylase
MIAWEGEFVAEKSGTVNALRFITKNILAVVQEEGRTIDWLNHYMSLPVANPVQVKAGDVVQVGFSYRAGGSLPSLEATMRVSVAQDMVATPMQHQSTHA